MQRRRIGWTTILCALAAAASSGACATRGGGITLPTLAGPRIVAAHRASGNAVHIRMSADGVQWTEGAPVISNGFTMLTFVEPTIAFESGLYHLYWLDAAGVRYATSRDGEQWLVQNTAMTQMPAASQPVFVRGNGHSFAFTSGATGISQIDLDNPLTRTTIPLRTSARPSATFGAGRFVVAGVDAARHPVVVTSTDGRQWSTPVSINLAGAYLVSVSFSGGRWRLAAKRRTASADEDLPGVGCNVFDSADAAVWTELPAPPCGNVPSEPTPFRHGGADLVIFNVDNRVVSVSVNGGRLQDTPFVLPIGRISMTVGPGPQLAAFHLDRAQVVSGVRQDMTIASLGYHVRVGEPGSARVTYSGQVVEFASDLNVGQQSAIPPLVSPPAWIVHPAKDLMQSTGRLDLMGGVQIAIDRGACPEGPIRDKLNDARAALEDAMNRHLSAAATSDLLDDTKRQRVTDLISCEVTKTIEGGNPNSCTAGPARPSQTSVLEALGNVLSAAADAIGNLFVSAATDLACGFNQDQQLEPADILIVGTEFYPEGNAPRTAYRIDSATASRPLDNFSVRTADGSKNWTIGSTLKFVGIP